MVLGIPILRNPYFWLLIWVWTKKNNTILSHRHEHRQLLVISHVWLTLTTTAPLTYILGIIPPMKCSKNPPAADEIGLITVDQSKKTIISKLDTSNIHIDWMCNISYPSTFNIFQLYKDWKRFNLSRDISYETSRELQDLPIFPIFPAGFRVLRRNWACGPATRSPWVSLGFWMYIPVFNHPGLWMFILKKDQLFMVYSW